VVQMNTLCIVSFFFAAVCGLPIQSMKDPISFVDTTNEGAADDILSMIDQLRNDNAAAMDHATNALSSAQDDNDSAKDALDRATHAAEQALGDVVEGDATLVDLQGKAASARAVEADAAGKKADAQDVADKEAADLVSETERLDGEKETLEEVIDLINSLAEMAALQIVNNRQLLSVVDLSSLANADPAAVAEVKKLLEDLVAVGEAERTQAIQDDADAKAALEVATADWKVTYDDLANALGRVDFQVQVNADLADVSAAAVAAKNAASTAFQNAAQVLGNAQKHFDDETVRTTDEEDTFSKVEALIATLA